MPEPYAPKVRPFPLSELTRSGSIQLLRIRCRYCKRTNHYRPDELIQVFGDVDVDSLAYRMRCEAGDHGVLELRAFTPAGAELVGLRIRRLVAIKIQRVPVWRDE